MQAQKSQHDSSKYTVQSYKFQPQKSPFHQKKGNNKYPVNFIYLNRKNKLRKCELTPVFEVIDMPSTIEAEESLEMRQRIYNTASYELQSRIKAFLIRNPPPTPVKKEKKRKAPPIILSLEDSFGNNTSGGEVGQPQD